MICLACGSTDISRQHSKVGNFELFRKNALGISSKTNDIPTNDMIVITKRAE